MSDIIKTWFKDQDLSFLITSGDNYGFQYATNNANFMITPTDADVEQSFWNWVEDKL